MLSTLRRNQRLFGPYLQVTKRHFLATGNLADFFNHERYHEALSRQLISVYKFEKCPKDKIDVLVSLLGPTDHLKTGLDLVGHGKLIQHLDDLITCDTPTINVYLKYARKLRESDINNGAKTLVEFKTLTPEQQTKLIDKPYNTFESMGYNR